MPRIRSLARIAIIALFTASFAVGAATTAADTKAPIDLALYDRLLSAHTRAVPEMAGTRVDYKAISRSEDWQKLSKQVRTARPSRLSGDARLTYWINAYNILTIDLIVENYPLESIRDIGSFFSPVWDKQIATIEGRDLSLGEIEHEILRKVGEPRIHAAIVCASTSCPPLARTAFRASAINEDLDAAMRRWLASPKKGVSIDRRAGVVHVSAIFDWFEEDFEAAGGVLSTIAEFMSPTDAAWLRGTGRRARIRYLGYDWSLNDLR